MPHRHSWTVDGIRLGTVCRALRIKKRWRQVDVAARAGVSRTTVSRIERGDVSRLRVACSDQRRCRRSAAVSISWCVGRVASWTACSMPAIRRSTNPSLAGLAATRAGSSLPRCRSRFAGNAGVIDILAWHAESRTLLVIELKTEIVDINELMGTLDRKRRLAPLVARERGWYPRAVALWLIVADSVTNRRRVRSHAATLRAALPSDGRSMSGWLKRPASELRCLSFWSYDRRANTKSGSCNGPARAQVG